MTVKREREASPPAAALADRLAKYAYTTPSPSPNVKRGPSAVKIEPRSPLSNRGPSDLRAGRVAAVELESTDQASRHVSRVFDGREGEAGPSRWMVGSDDDLESLTEDVEVEWDTPRRSGPGRARWPLRKRVAESLSNASEDEAYHDDEIGQDESDSVPSSPRRQRQTRIPTRRATRHDRISTSAPQVLEAPSSAAPRKRRKRSESDEGNASGARRPRRYADPETYRHLKPLPDILAPDLDLVFCGINPGMKSSTLGHHFAHPTNKFWRSLHYSGLTSRLVPTTEDHLLPTEFNYGLTVLVDRPTAEQSELSTQEMRLNALPFTEKLLRLRPRIVCFVGKKIWDVYESVIAKTARPAPAYNSPRPINVDQDGDRVVKLEPASTASTPIKAETDSGTAALEVHSPTNLRTPETPRRTSGQPKPKVKAEVRFDWTQPRAFRLPHHHDHDHHHDHHGGQVTAYTYFWVVPNTSGLERTPLTEQIVLFGHLNRFKNEVKDGHVRGMGFREFDVEGVRRTIEKMQKAERD